MNTRTNAFPWLAIGISFGVVTTGLAQAPQDPEAVALDALRTRSGISAGDPTIDAWITFRLNALREGLVPAEAAAEFIKAYRDQYTHAENSESFKQRLAEQTGKRFAAEFQNNPELKPATAEVLARVLLILASPETMEGLVAGLRDSKRPAVRYYSAKALTGLIPDLSADQSRTASTLQLLRDAGAQESNPVVLRQIYEAMFYRERLNLTVPALLDLMEARLRTRAGDQPGATGAEEVVVAFFKRELANITEKNRVVNVLATQLRLDVERYLAGEVSDDEKWILERSIDGIEAMLVQIVAPSSPVPNVRDAMKKPENQDVNMPLELYKWVGTPQQRGVLNEAPWNVPVGAPVRG